MPGPVIRKPSVGEKMLPGKMPLIIRFTAMQQNVLALGFEESPDEVKERGRHAGILRASSRAILQKGEIKNKARQLDISQQRHFQKAGRIRNSVVGSEAEDAISHRHQVRLTYQTSGTCSLALSGGPRRRA